MVDLLITGGAGFVGQNLTRFFASRMAVVAADWKTPLPPDLGTTAVEMDVRDAGRVRAVLEQVRPRAVIHAAGNKNVRDCEQHPEEAFRTNATGTRNVARACREVGAHLLYLSTDLVFDCQQGGYEEHDIPHPTLVYGETKRQGEIFAFEECPEAAVCRSGGIYGRRSPLLAWLGAQLAAGRTVEGFTDVFNSPTYVGSLADMMQAVVLRRLSGVFHMVGSVRTSRYDFFRTFAETFDLDAALLSAVAAGARRHEMLLLPDASLRCRRTTAALGIEPASPWDGLTRLRHEGGV
jgi:dTDP-4-dehydrorhamnose reductase